MIAPHGFQVSFPRELPAQGTHPSLTMKPDNEAEAFLDHVPFGRFWTGFERRRHELVVDDNIGSHEICTSTRTCFDGERDGLFAHCRAS
jgi:hypothetical protein